MSHKIFRSILLVAAAVLLASLLIIMSYLYEYFAGVQERQHADRTHDVGFTGAGTAVFAHHAHCETGGAAVVCFDGIPTLNSAGSAAVRVHPVVQSKA